MQKYRKVSGVRENISENPCATQSQNSTQESDAESFDTAFAIIGLTLVLSGCDELNTYRIEGAVTGLDGTVVIQNFADEITIEADKNFTFKIDSVNDTPVPYEVMVKTQPLTQTCAVTNGSGTTNTDVSNVKVTCTTN